MFNYNSLELHFNHIYNPTRTIQTTIMARPEVIYFEGLPFSGKTSIVTQIAQEHPDEFIAVEEYIHPDKNVPGVFDYQEFFMRNDELKYRIARECGKRCLVDRGHLSTVLYSHAYGKIKGDRDLSFVDEWYIEKILGNNMLPDMYVHLDVSPETSMARRTGALAEDNMWDYVEGLQFARTHFPLYVALYESHIPVLTLDSEIKSVAELKTDVVSALDIK